MSDLSRLLDQVRSAALTVDVIAQFASASTRVAVVNAGGVAPLVDMLRDERTQRPAAIALSCLCCCSHAKAATPIVEAGGIAPLVAMLRTGHDADRRYASAAVATLAGHSVACREAIAKAGAIAPLVEMLHATNVTERTNACAALGGLAFHHDANGDAIAAEPGSVASLVALVRIGGTASCRAFAAGALANLSQRHAAAIAAAGGIEALVHLLRHGDARGQTNATSALGILVAADVSLVRVIAATGAIAWLVELLRTSRLARDHTNAASVLHFLMVDRDTIDALVLAGGIAPLVAWVRDAPNDWGKTLAARVLRRVAMGSDAHRESIALHDGIGALRQLARDGSDDAKDAARSALRLVGMANLANAGHIEALRALE